MMRDGWAGVNAHIYLPFYGYWFASGAVFTPARSQIAQSTQPFIGGITKPNVGAPAVCA